MWYSDFKVKGGDEINYLKGAIVLVCVVVFIVVVTNFDAKGSTKEEALIANRLVYDCDSRVPYDTYKVFTYNIHMEDLKIIEGKLIQLIVYAIN